MHEKHSLQILSKLETAALEENEHTFALLNTDEDYTKDEDAQLTAANWMIKSH